MTKLTLSSLLLLIAFPLATTASAQNNEMQNMPNMKSPGGSQEHHSIVDDHMDMGSHMKMTSPRSEQPGDRVKAEQVLKAARQVCEKYKDYKVALADGFQIFFPNVPQMQYHFNNPDYAREAARHFNPAHPTSLLYEKVDNGYKLVGVMYTAPRSATEDELNERIPLSIAHWHQHVNLCFGPSERSEALASKFGFHGSISTEPECRVAGGMFVPQAFGWMVHIYPFAEEPSEIWSVERQQANSAL
jgi:hypothetical protein